MGGEEREQEAEKNRKTGNRSRSDCALFPDASVRVDSPFLPGYDNRLLPCHQAGRARNHQHMVQTVDSGRKH